MANENPYAKYAQQAAPQRGIVIADPNAGAEERRAQQDQEFEAERLRNEQTRIAIAQQQANISAQSAAVTAQNANKPPAGYQWGLGGQLQAIPGGPADPAVVQASKAKPAPQVDPDRTPQIQTALANISRLRELSDDNLAVGRLSGRIGDFPLIGSFLGQNRANVEGALQMVEGDLIQQQIARLSQLNGGNGVASLANSEGEARRMAASIANLDPNQDLTEFTKGLDRAEAYYKRQLARQLAQDPALPNALTMNRFVGGAGPTAAGAGATMASGALPPAMQAEYEAGLPNVIRDGRIDPQAYAQFRTALDEKYGYSGNYDTNLQWAEAANERLAQGGATVSTQIPSPDRELTELEQARNNAVSNPVGAFAASAGNAGAFGLPGVLAGEQLDALQEAAPVATFLGEVGGGITGTLAAGAGLGALAGRVGNPALAGALSRPITADTLYGATYGATSADDPLYGAVIGGAGAAGGSTIGSRIARRLPGSVGLSRPNDTLNRGERAVLGTVGDVDPVIAALRGASDLNVPASIADVSPEVNTLAGAALRRSPAASGQAREALAARGRGQYDRFNSAIARDLGPIANVPQQSEDLIQQARAAAGPLYDEAYAAPGAGAIFPKIETLLNRPSMRRSMARARRIAAEEGRDPATLGFDLDDAGEVVLTSVPSWQTLDYVKRGIDDVLEPYRNPITNKLVLDEEGRAINNTLRTFLGTVDEFNPQYGAARNAYAGPAAEREALQQGQGAVRLPPDELRMMVGRATPSQQGQMRLGMQSALSEAAGRGRNNSNPFQSVLDTPAMEQRLGIMYGQNGDVARLLTQRNLERDLASSANRLVGNSMTAERQVADQALNQTSLAGDVVSGLLETAATGAPVATAVRSAAGRGLGGAIRDWRTLGAGRRAAEMSDQIADVSLDMNPQAAIGRLTDMGTRDAAYQVILQELLQSAGVRGGRIGAATGSATTN